MRVCVCVYACSGVVGMMGMLYRVEETNELCMRESDALVMKGYRYMYMRKGLGIFLENCEKTGSHPGLNWGPLTLAVSALPPDNSQYHSVCTCMYRCVCVCVCVSVCVDEKLKINYA